MDLNLTPENPALVFPVTEGTDGNLVTAIGVSQARADELRHKLKELAFTRRDADPDGEISSQYVAQIALYIAKTPQELFYMAFALGYKQCKLEVQEAWEVGSNVANQIPQ